MSFDFFFKACNFWSKNLPTCDTCTGRMTSHSNLESISRQSEIQDPNISIDSENIPYQSKITPPTGVLEIIILQHLLDKKNQKISVLIQKTINFQKSKKRSLVARRRQFSDKVS